MTLWRKEGIVLDIMQQAVIELARRKLVCRQKISGSFVTGDQVFLEPLKEQMAWQLTSSYGRDMHMLDYER